MSNCNHTNIAGEMFVAGELSKRGYSVSLTMGNTKAVDVFAERNGKAICIQVKAIAKDGGWPLPRQANIIEGVIFVCVVLNDVGSPPTYYVLPSSEVLAGGKWYKNRATLHLSTCKRDRFRDAWSIIDQAIFNDPILSPG